MPLIIAQENGTFVIHPDKLPIMPAPEMISASDAAKSLGLNPRTVGRWCEQGIFKTAIKPGGLPGSHWQIDRGEVEALRLQRRK